MSIPHKRPGPLSISTSTRPRPVKLLRLNKASNTGSGILQATLAAESSDSDHQVLRSVDPLKPEDHPDSDVENSKSDSNDSNSSEASGSDSVVSFFEQVIID